ncbi:uroporphyrinogen decarboxylase family protein [Saccharicrinis fermentans]|uniref:Methylcobalamin:coenzyme M methyltransferase n=1 Tax=Saccharicrinis fermentans DSM 9555 = JCM 21142 TaxID=869213 RepID=W7XWJ0_9BACT|nr:uroporphyrinogen decarboxylase family protein [Saccharicrinis fermentans]GAF02695.1 methylcobalamin:coenzyme M methyltransferase [Saccharicrinis fermentans DSM 9555 = JCM 21142]
MEALVDNHFIKLGQSSGFKVDIGNNRKKDIFGVTWDMTLEKDIGNVEGLVIPEPTMEGYEFPDIENPMLYEGIEEKIAANKDKFVLYSIGFSLFERYWTLRGMENAFLDFMMYPDFVKDLLRKIADFNIAVITNVCERYPEVDGIYFGDDWGAQQGLMMGKEVWMEFLYPELKRMYANTKSHGKYQLIHSCGDIAEVIPELIDAGVNSINPFQPEVLNVDELLNTYRGKVTFHGGLSTQKTLPYGTVQDVKDETMHLLELGKDGSYIFCPSHATEGDTPIENIVAFIDLIKAQKR